MVHIKGWLFLLPNQLRKIKDFFISPINWRKNEAIDCQTSSSEKGDDTSLSIPREVVLKRFTAIALSVILAGTSLAALAAAMQSVELSSAPSGVEILSQDRAGLRLKLEIGTIDFVPVSTPEGTFTLVKVDGLTRSFRVGEPSIPVANKVLSIPYDCELRAEVIDYETEEISLADLNLTYPLMPVQPPLSKSDDPASVPFEYNRDVYSALGYYTLPLVEVKVLGTMRAMRLGMISISPIEYNPNQNKLKVYKNITIRVNYQNPDWEKTRSMQSRLYSPFFEPIYERVINYAGQPADLGDNLVKYPVKYLIISDRMFEAQLQPFIEWKTKKGFSVVTAYTDSIGTTDTAIKAYIQGVYEAGTAEDPAPSFVLFVGDAQQIPPFSGSTDYHVTDKKFCEFTGDDFPEIYYGRFSAQDSSQLQPQIDKTLEYEQYLMPDPYYLGEVTMVSGVDHTYAATYGNGQISYGTSLYFNEAHGISPNVWLYPESNQSGAAEAIIQTINNGIGFYNYTAHCAHSGHSNPPFTTDDLPNLTNYHKYVLGIGNCCEPNTFGTDYASPCFGEAFLQLEEKGGIGYIGGTNSTYWDEDYWWGVGYGPIVDSGPTYEETGIGAYDGVFHDHGEPVNQHYIANDAIVFAGNLAVTESGSPKKSYYWEIYHIMGDPSVTTYLGLPANNNVTHLAAIPLTDTLFTVQADPGSYVGITIDGELHGAGYVDTSGFVDIPLEPFASPGIADIVVTAQNRIPYFSDIQVIASEGPYVMYNDHSINDTSGNNDSLVNYGESISLDVQLINIGMDSAINVDATLSTEDSFVTITDDYEIYGAIPGDFGTLNISDAFSFDVAGDTPDEHNIQFQLAVNDSDLDTTWISNFAIPVHSPAMSFVSVSVDDASGDGDGILDPGETGELIITLENAGSANAISVSGILSESDDYVTVIDDQGYFGDIEASGGSGDNSTDTYVVSADPACLPGHPITFQLELSGDGGYVGAVEFEFIIGHREVFFSDDFSTDQGWTGFDGEGEWTIGPAVGGSGSDTYGGPDPSEDHSPSADNHVLGNDLTLEEGDYNGSLNGTYWITSPVFDCSPFTGVQMTIYRWLGVERSRYDHAYLQVYDGSSWVTIFENGSSTIDDSSWSEQFYDLCQYADSNPDFQIRFGIGPTDYSMNYCGWNIDDVELKAYGEPPSDPPELVYEPTAIIDSLHQGDSTVDTIKVYNIGGALLRIGFSSPDSWLDLDTALQNVFAGDSLLLPVTINAVGLTPGDHSGSIQFVSNDPLEPSGSIPVSLHIYAPDIFIADTLIKDTVLSGEQSSQHFVIYNNGQGKLEYEISCQVFDEKKEDRGSDTTDARSTDDYIIDPQELSRVGGLETVSKAEDMLEGTPPSSKAADWLSVEPDSGTIEPFGADTVDVMLDAIELVKGEYNGQLTIFSNDPDTPVLQVPVAMTVDQVFVCGDVNNDGVINILDITHLIAYLYKGGPPPVIQEAADVDSSGEIDLLDITCLINYLYREGPEPNCP